MATNLPNISRYSRSTLINAVFRQFSYPFSNFAISTVYLYIRDSAFLNSTLSNSARRFWAKLIIYSTGKGAVWQRKKKTSSLIELRSRVKIFSFYFRFINFCIRYYRVAHCPLSDSLFASGIKLTPLLSSGKK
jgi:hypothetical protein